MAAIIDLPLSTLAGFIRHALEKEKERASWGLWQSLYPFMMCDLIKHVSFADFQRELFKPKLKYSEKSFEEIEQEMLAVVEAYEGR